MQGNLKTYQAQQIAELKAGGHVDGFRGVDAWTHHDVIFQ